ncbi:MAG: glycosyltransferase family 4 protein [Cyclobacteriaceae bacterium]|nr:glycosyltransferase family 4 protein [Cyclobacteriaceae bacterium]
MSKSRILVLENSIAITGALKSIASVSRELQSSFSFTFILPKKSEGRVLLDQLNVKDVLEWRMIEIRRSLFSLIFYLPTLVRNAMLLKKTVEARKIDLIHVNDIYNLLPPFARLMGCKTPYVCHVRFMPKNFPTALFNFWFKVHGRYAKKIIVVSRAVYNELPLHEKVEIVYDGFYFEHKKPHSIERKESDPFIFLYVANMIEGKGQNFAIRAFQKVHNQLAGWKLRFVGGNMGLSKNQKYLEALKQLARSLEVDDKIEWVGFTDDVEKEYKHADVALNFSSSESFSMTSLEALANECPLIVTDCGGPAEIVENGVTGLLVENGNVDEMASAMIKLASSQELRKKMAAQGFEFALRTFNVKNTSARVKQIYETCMKSE